MQRLKSIKIKNKCEEAYEEYKTIAKNRINIEEIQNTFNVDKKPPFISLY